MTTSRGRHQDRLPRALHELLALEVMDLERALDAAAQQIADAMHADKVDVFLHEQATGELVAVGTNDSAMARQQKALGLDRLPVAGGGTTAQVFRTGQSRLRRDLDRDPLEIRGVVEDLGVRSQISVPLLVRGERRGVVMSARPSPSTSLTMTSASRRRWRAGSDWSATAPRPSNRPSPRPPAMGSASPPRTRSGS